MSDIFLSWGSPDAAIAGSLIKRLRDNGLHVWEYDTSGAAGENVSDSVSLEIRRARTVVVLISPDTKDRPWVLSELTLALDAQSRGEVWQVIPVLLDGLPDAELPDPVRRRNIRSFALSQGEGQEEALARLVGDIRKGLGTHAPLVVPTALLAMTREEFTNIFPPDSSGNELLESICAKVGMHHQPVLREELEQRYGDIPEDFAPFGVTPLRDLVQEAQGTANKKRQERGQPTVHLRWFSRDDFKPQDLRNLWQRSRSLLIVDSVSTFSPAISALIEKLPQMTQARDLAIVWVPPYTRHTVKLEALIRASLQAPSFLADTFEAWTGPDFDIPFLAFDVATTTALKRWVSQTLESFSVDQRPDPRNVERFAGPAPRPSMRLTEQLYLPDAGGMP